MSAETSTETVNDTPGETPVEVIDNPTPDSAAPAVEPAATPEPGSTPSQENRLPDDHPLVKAYTSSQELVKQLKGTHQSKVQELETQVSELTAKASSADTVQAKYERLESFLTSLGGPISKALDSKSFSVALFESDADVKDLVAQWHKDNPSATSSALNSGPGNTKGAADMNALLRTAAR